MGCGQHLVGGGLAFEELLGALVFGPGLAELGFGGGQLLADVAGIEDDELLAFLHAVARGNEHLFDGGRDAGAQGDLFFGGRGADDFDPHGGGFGFHFDRRGAFRHREARFVRQLAGFGLRAEEAAGPDDDGREAEQTESELEVFFEVNGDFHALISWALSKWVGGISRFPIRPWLSSDWTGRSDSRSGRRRRGFPWR